MSEFIKETRYIVLKLSKMTDGEKQSIYHAIQQTEMSSDATPKCVVVEHDWPNYQDTWADIQAIVEGDFLSKAKLLSQNAELLAMVEKFTTVIAERFTSKERQPDDTVITDGAPWALELLRTTPAQHLRDRDAEVGRAGFVACSQWINDEDDGRHTVTEASDEYAEKVRRGEV